MKTGRINQGYGIIQRDVMKLKISIYSKAVYCLLVSYAGNKDSCFPSLKTMCDDLEISKNTLIKSLKELISIKLIIADRRKTKDGDFASNIYYPMQIMDSDAIHIMNNGSSPNEQPVVHHVNTNINSYNINKEDTSFKKEAKAEVETSVVDKDIFGNEVKASNKPKQPKTKKEKSARENSEIHAVCKKYWLDEFHKGWSFDATAGDHLYKIIAKLKKKLSEQRSVVNDSDVSDLFKTFCQKLPEFYITEDIPVLNSKFNTIFEKIKLNIHAPKQSTPKGFSRFRS